VKAQQQGKLMLTLYQ